MKSKLTHPAATAYSKDWTNERQHEHTTLEYSVIELKSNTSAWEGIDRVCSNGIDWDSPTIRRFSLCAPGELVETASSYLILRLLIKPVQFRQR